MKTAVLSWSMAAVFISALYHCHAKQIASPPKLTETEVAEVAFKPFERVELRCEAVGEPGPTFTWKRNNIDITYNMTDVRKGGGTLVIPSPTAAHEGVYQCFAQNPYGLAVSTKTRLKEAVIHPFPTLTQKPVHTPLIGDGFKLSCEPPYNYPTGGGNIYWSLITPDNTEDIFRNVQISDRIALDYSGALYFANVQDVDSAEGRTYTCTVRNDRLRTTVQGSDQFIKPKLPPSGAPSVKAPTLAWSSPIFTVALKGTTAAMKCIFYGYPTPRVEWEKVSIGIESDSVTSQTLGQRHLGMELVLSEVEMSDAGVYRCRASNSASPIPATLDITLQVASAPVFEVKPIDQVKAEGADAEFVCKPSGSPTPTLTWMSNGRLLDTVLESNPRMSMSADGTKLTIQQVTIDDMQVFQCNASNIHGYTFENAALSIVSLSQASEVASASSLWLIIILLILLLLTTIFMILFYVKYRNRGQDYSVYKKEKLRRGDIPDEEDGFDKYTSPDSHDEMLEEQDQSLKAS